jgi:hypothetical protein
MAFNIIRDKSFSTDIFNNNPYGLYFIYPSAFSKYIIATPELNQYSICSFTNSNIFSRGY